MVSGAIAATTAIGGGILSSKSQKKAGKQAKKLARKNAETERFELEESLRRLDLSQEQFRGQQAAAAGASGLNIARGSVAKFLSQQKEEMAKEREFAETQGNRRIDLILQGGQNAQALAKAQATQSLISGFGSAATSLSSGYRDLQQARATNPNTKWWQV